MTRKIIVFFKIFPHLNEEDRVNLLKEIKEVFKNKDKGYKDFIKYYEKNWLNYTIDFDEIESKGRLVRTNNICERYNERLIRKIGIL